MENQNNYSYINQINNNGFYSKFQFIPPPELPFQRNIPSNSNKNFQNSKDLNIMETSYSYNQTMNNNNLYLNNTITNNADNNLNMVHNYNGKASNLYIPTQGNLQNQSLFNNFNKSMKGENENKNENIKRPIIKNVFLSKYIEKDKEWFEKWYKSIDKNKVDDINSFKRIKIMDVFNSFLDIYNNIEEMKKEKKRIIDKENDTKSVEFPLNDFNEIINKCNSLENNILTQLDKLDNANAISNWKFKNNKIKKKRNHDKKKNSKNKIEKNKKEEKNKNSQVIKSNINIRSSNLNLEEKCNNADSIQNKIDKATPFFNIDNLIKKQKIEKDKDLIECQNLIDIIQKLQKIRNIRKSKSDKQSDISWFENNLNIKNLDDKINELSQIIKPIKLKKKKKNNKNKNKLNNDSLIQNKSNNISNTLSSHLNSINNTSIFIKKKKIYHYSEKNRKLLKIKCEPYSNVYEYFNNTKLDMKSLIYIRKEWDKYIVKDGGSSIPPNYVKPDPPASIYWSQYLINENKTKK